MTELAILLHLLRVMTLTIATCIGSVGVYALICSSLNPHPDAAVFALVTLPLATGIMIALPDRGRW